MHDTLMPQHPARVSIASEAFPGHPANLPECGFLIDAGIRLATELRTRRAIQGDFCGDNGLNSPPKVQVVRTTGGCYSIATSSGNRKVVAPSANCTRNIERSRLRI